MIEFQLFARHCATNLYIHHLVSLYNNFARYMCPIVFILKFNFGSEGTFGLSWARGHVGSLVLRPGRTPALEGEVLATVTTRAIPMRPILQKGLEGAQGHMERQLERSHEISVPCLKPLCSKKLRTY